MDAGATGAQVERHRGLSAGLGAGSVSTVASQPGRTTTFGPMSDGDYGYVIYGDDTDRWLDDEYEAFALDYNTLEADPNDPR